MRRRTFLAAGLALIAAPFGALRMMDQPDVRAPLEMDPDREHFEYVDGWIVQRPSRDR